MVDVGERGVCAPNALPSHEQEEAMAIGFGESVGHISTTQSL